MIRKGERLCVHVSIAVKILAGTRQARLFAGCALGVDIRQEQRGETTMTRKIYRARGRYEGARQDNWITNVWRRAKEEAAGDVNAFGNRYTNTRVVEEDYDEYLRKKQRLPRF